MRILHFFIFLTLATAVVAQKKSNTFYNFKNQLGINFTNVLGNVLSLNPNNASSPYGLSYRRHYATSSFRSAINGAIKSTNTTEFNSNDFLNKTLKTTEVNFRAGLEKHLPLYSKMMMTYGADILLGYNKEHSNVSTFFSQGQSRNFVSDMNTYTIGFGPVLRLEFKISDRLHLSTESTLYGLYGKTSETLSINGILSDEPKKQVSSLRLELPQSLFFNISF
ncbi:MAG: hypothetical protein WAT22_03860 [Saprospiraceae bacterium]